ncbi:MAG: 4-hydroxy-tetrahydrodipicolinate reductase [Candidatus Wukongarchaeota archaeon]|nr:4-hydroxy-tetrahydrodipicolinate reductase [Candidatus Wukongarchaeota archaeon]
MTKICVAGATGRMGSILIQEAYNIGYEVVGAVTASNDPALGKTLKNLGIYDSNVEVVSPNKIEDAVKKADVYFSFTTPEAELQNIPQITHLGVPIIIGTTGFTKEQEKKIHSTVSGKVPTIIASNFALGINLLLKIINVCELLPVDYNFTIIEGHHIGKKDAPSGTAKKLGEKISKIRGYNKTIHGREGVSPRSETELEILSFRGGGLPGVHEIIINGPHEMIKIEHLAFSRRVFAQGALFAAEWLIKRKKPEIFTMEDVFGNY